MNPKKILVLKHGSLGDIISATTAFKSLRDQYNSSTIHLLTTKKYSNLLENSNLFNEIIIDNRNNYILSLKLIFKLIKHKYDLVVDLQNSQRTMIYCFFFRILSSTQWNGTRLGSTFRYCYDKKNPPHIIEGLSNQIRLIGVDCVKNPHIDWLEKNYSLPKEIENIPFFIINPGCSKKNQQKKWNALNYVKICDYLIGKKIKPVLIGSHEDSEDINYIVSKTKSALNLLNLSPLSAIFSLSKKALGALSNDTGPAHLIAGSGCKIHLVLSTFSKVNLVIPKGENVTYTQKQNINNIKPEEIILELNKMLKI